jgi:hypothetical protein
LPFGLVESTSSFAEAEEKAKAYPSARRHFPGRAERAAPKGGALIINPSVRITLPVQTVDATPSNQLIRQYFPKRIVLCGKTQSEPKQGSVLFESTLANEIGFVDS